MPFKKSYPCDYTYIKLRFKTSSEKKNLGLSLTLITFTKETFLYHHRNICNLNVWGHKTPKKKNVSSGGGVMHLTLRILNAL